MFIIENTRYQTGDVGIDDWDRLIERESSDGICGITADTGERTEFVD